MMQIKRWVGLFLLAVGLAGCGTEDGVYGGETGITAYLSSLTLVVSSPQLQSNNTDVVTITATTKDENNALLSGVPVTFSATSGDLTVLDTATDDYGQAQAELKSGTEDLSNRNITVTVTAGELNKTAAIAVSGTELAISGPESVIAGETVTYTVTLSDADGDGIEGQTITASSSLSGTTIQPVGGTYVTDTDGQLKVDVTAQSSHTLTFSALGATATLAVSVSTDTFSVTISDTSGQATTSSAGLLEIPIDSCPKVAAHWEQSGAAVSGQPVEFSTSRGKLYSDAACTSEIATTPAEVVTDANGDAIVYLDSPNPGLVNVVAGDSSDMVSDSDEAEFVATTPATISLSADRSVVGIGESATLTAKVLDVNGNVVKNKEVYFTVVEDGGSGGRVDPQMAKTGTDGKASSTFKDATTATGQEDVVITATVAGTISDTYYLTVAEDALRVNLGMATKIASPTDATYSYPGVVMVSDAAGNPKANAEVTLSLDVPYYDKGWFSVGYTSSITGTTVSMDLSCANEDLDRDGIIDAGEDTDGDGGLDPAFPGSVADSSGNNVVTTNAQGYAEFFVTYPKDYAYWTQVKVTATTKVGGSEGVGSMEFLLPISEDDSDSPPGTTSPYGTAASCAIDG